MNFSGTNPGKSSYKGSHGGNSCSFVLTSVAKQSYQFYFTASDGLNSTISSLQTVETGTDDRNSAGKTLIYSELEKQGQLKSEGGNTFSVVGEGSGSNEGLLQKFWNWLKDLFS